MTKYMRISSYIREPFLCNRSYLNFFIYEGQRCNGDSEKSSAQAHLRNILTTGAMDRTSAPPQVS
jgi:hypothetical protein